MRVKTIASLMLFVVGLVVTAICGCSRVQEHQTMSDDEIKVSHWEELAYPPLARSARVAGVVVMLVKLDDAGNVTSSEVVSGNRYLIHDCMSNSKKWHFEPNPRKSAVIVYDFRLDGPPCETPCRSQFVFRSPNVAVITTGQPFVQPSSSSN